jgi:hypothetical protein
LQELHSKGNNSIYNNFLAVLSKLSHEFLEISHEKSVIIISELLKFISKDKHLVIIIEKLCQKMQNENE